MALAWLAGISAGDDVRIGGLLPLDADRAARWCWSGTFRMPVGDPVTLGDPGPDGEPGFEVNRGVGESGHQGVDLDNRRGGDTVRAAAHGLVVAASDGWNGGYGTRVVIAHRLADETLAYSVYAHLVHGSLGARAGEAVPAGRPLGLVGRSGRATTEHLHFEIRRPDDSGARWEHARVVDPIAFVTARLPSPPDSTWPGACLAWARDAALIPAGAEPAKPVDHARWWTMLARIAKHGLPRLPDDPAGLRAALVAAGLLPETVTRETAGEVDWAELRSDLERVRRAGVRVPPIEPDPDGHRRTPAREPAGAEPDRAPTLAQACVALAEAAGAGAGTDAGGRPRPRRNPAR